MEVSELITVTGSTGYVGGRLVPELLQNGYRVRCVTRSAESLQDRDWTDQVEIVEANLEEKNEVVAALKGSDRALYLVHSMSATRNFAEAEQKIAKNFVEVPLYVPVSIQTDSLFECSKKIEFLIN